MGWLGGSLLQPAAQSSRASQPPPSLAELETSKDRDSSLYRCLSHAVLPSWKKRFPPVHSKPHKQQSVPLLCWVPLLEEGLTPLGVEGLLAGVRTTSTAAEQEESLHQDNSSVAIHQLFRYKLPSSDLLVGYWSLSRRFELITAHLVISKGLVALWSSLHWWFLCSPWHLRSVGGCSSK